MITNGDFYEFGPFRLDVSARALYRRDEYVPLTPKAFDLLHLLVEEAGHLVTKETILARVWPDAFVEEGSIANNISALRKVLNPPFDDDGPIVTVSRRGYRFTAPVRLRNDDAQIAVVAAEVTANSRSAEAASARGPADAAKADDTNRIPAGRADRSYMRALAIAATILVVVGVATFTAMRVRTADPAEARSMRRAVAILSMKNLSGKDEYAWFSTALSESINTELISGGQLRIISGAAVRQMLADHAPQPGEPMSRKQLDEIGRGLGCDLILTGTYLHTAGRVRLDLRLDDIASGQTVATVTAEESEDQLLDLVSAANRELRARLGLTPPLPGQPDAIRASLSSNPEALRSYFLGLEALRNHEVNRSTDLLTQAIAADPDFALAHSVISISWRVLGYDDKSQAAAQKAFALAPALAREDRLAVEGAYYEVMGEVPKAIEKYQSLWNFFPDNIAYGIKLAHQQLRGGKLDEARRTIDQMRALPPPADGDPRVNVVESDWHLRKGQFADAARVAGEGADKATRRKSPQLRAILTMTQGQAATKLGDLDHARRSFSEALKIYDELADLGGTAEALRGDALVLHEQGKMADAEQRLNRAVEIGLKIKHARALQEIYIARSNVMRELGKPALAKRDAEAALSQARTSQHQSAIARSLTALGSALAAQGDYAAGRGHLEEADRIARAIAEPAAIATVGRELENLAAAEARAMTFAHRTGR